MNVRNVNKFIQDKTNEFVISLNKRYQEHVSDTFIVAYILSEFIPKVKKNPNIRLEQAAYDSCVYLFESLLEHGCSVIGNGHHVAQYFASYFSNKTIEFNKENILDEIKKSVIQFVKDSDDEDFYLHDWFRYFFDEIECQNWIKTKVTDGEDDDLEDLDLENFEILELNKKYLLFCAYGDWQDPRKVKMFYLENEKYSFEEVSKEYEHGLTEKQFAEILDLKFDEKNNMIILNK
jgi:hypothetical protein